MNGIHSQTKHELFQQVRTYENLQLEHEAHEKYLRKLLREYQRELGSATTKLEIYETIGQTLGELLASEILKNRSLQANAHLEKAIMEAKRFVARKEATTKLNSDDEEPKLENSQHAAKLYVEETRISPINTKEEQRRLTDRQESVRSESAGAAKSDSETGRVDGATMSTNVKETTQKNDVEKVKEEEKKDDKVKYSNSRLAEEKVKALPETVGNGLEEELILYLNAATKRSTSQRVLKLTMSEAQKLLIDTEFLISNYQQFTHKGHSTKELFEESADQVRSLMVEFQGSVDELVNQIEKRPFYQRKLKMTVADWQKWLFFRAFSFYCAWRNEQMPLQNLRIKWDELKKENR